MIFKTALTYEPYSCFFYLEDNGTYIVKIFEDGKLKAERKHKTREEVLDKYLRNFPTLDQYI